MTSPGHGPGRAAGLAGASSPARLSLYVRRPKGPVFLAAITDRVIAVIRQHVLPLDTESAWASVTAQVSPPTAHPDPALRRICTRAR